MERRMKWNIENGMENENGKQQNGIKQIRRSLVISGINIHLTQLH